MRSVPDPFSAGVGLACETKNGCGHQKCVKVYTSIRIGKKRGSGVGGSLLFRVTTVTDIEYHVGARSLYFLWLFGGQNSRKTTK